MLQRTLGTHLHDTAFPCHYKSLTCTAGTLPETLVSQTYALVYATLHIKNFLVRHFFGPSSGLEYFLARAWYLASSLMLTFSTPQPHATFTAGQSLLS